MRFSERAKICQRGFADARVARPWCWSDAECRRGVGLWWGACGVLGKRPCSGQRCCLAKASALPSLPKQPPKMPLVDPLTPCVSCRAGRSRPFSSRHLFLSPWPPPETHRVQLTKNTLMRHLAEREKPLVTCNCSTRDSSQINPSLPGVGSLLRKPPGANTRIPRAL